MKIRIIAVVVVIFFSACKHEPPELSPSANAINNGNNGGGSGGNNGGGNATPCDPNIMYFNKDILPIFITNCTNNNSGSSGGCHDVASHQNGIILTSYDNVMNTADVEPYDLSAGKLHEVITTNDPDDKMPPPPAAALSPQDIDKIEKWIMQGAQNLTCTSSSGCDTVNVSFSGKVWPIVNSKCKGCHSGNSPAGTIPLTDYGTVSVSIASGKFMGAITHSAGFFAMPKNSSKLSVCEIGVISNWISEGKLNN